MCWTALYRWEQKWPYENGRYCSTMRADVPVTASMPRREWGLTFLTSVIPLKKWKQISVSDSQRALQKGAKAQARCGPLGWCVKQALQCPAPLLTSGTHHLPHLSYKSMLFRYRFIPDTVFQSLLVNLSAISWLLFMWLTLSTVADTCSLGSHRGAQHPYPVCPSPSQNSGTTMTLQHSYSTTISWKLKLRPTFSNMQLSAASLLAVALQEGASQILMCTFSLLSLPGKRDFRISLYWGNQDLVWSSCCPLHFLRCCRPATSLEAARA